MRHAHCWCRLRSFRVGVRHLRWKGPAIKEEQERGRSTAERFVWVAVLLVCIVAAFIFALRGEVENQVALWIIRAVEGLIFMSALIRLGYDYPGTEFSSRTLWDWLQLLRGRANRRATYRT